MPIHHADALVNIIGIDCGNGIVDTKCFDAQAKFSPSSTSMKTSDLRLVCALREVSEVRRRLISLVFTLLVLAAHDAAAAPRDAQSQQPQIFDKRIVPGTRWIASITMERGEYVNCQIELNVEGGVQVRYTIGSKGSPVILLNDKYMERQVSETLGWTEGQSYRAQLFLDDKRFNVQAQRIGQHTLLIPLVSIDRETVFRAKKMALQVGGIAMRGYDVKGLDIASHELLDCYRQHGTDR
jgi:hypothetical protein